MILTCIVIALAAATAAVTISRSRLLDPLRQWPARRLARSVTPNSREWQALDLVDALLNCPYCLVHWLVLIAAAVYRPRLVHSGAPVLDVLVTAIAVIALAATAAGLLCKAYAFAAGER